MATVTQAMAPLFRDGVTAFRPGDAVLDYMTVPMRMAPDRVEERILVMLGRAAGRIRLFDLGPVAAVADLIAVPEAAAGHDTRRRLYDLLIRPVMSELKGVDRLAVVPDGLLTLVPFDVLIDRNGQPMVAALDMRIARSGRALAGGDHDMPQDADRSGVLLVGDVDYGGTASPLPLRPLPQPRRDPRKRDPGLSPRPRSHFRHSNLPLRELPRLS